MSEVAYKITNTTIQPKRLDPRTGKDLRTTTERVGHAVQWTDSKGDIVMLRPKSSPYYTTSLPEQIIALVRLGHVAVEKEADGLFSAIRQQHSITGVTKDVAALQPKAEAPEETKPLTKVKAIMMGMDGASEEKDPVNPDGPDNFTASVSDAKVSKKKTR